MTTNPIQAYGRWLAEAPDAWPAAARESAHRQFIDIIAVSVRGAAEEAAWRVFDAVRPWGAGPCTAIGMGAQLPAPWAALVNGTAAHVLDFDDNFDPGKTHATAVLAPAILALAEQEGLSGGACIDAYIAGLQIMARVGRGLNPPHRLRGWHATSTVGTIGTAAACSRLLRLDAESSAYALSLATSMTGGFMSQFGTMAKSLHAGLAAKNGLVAASLARSGVDAGLETLDGEKGMTRLMVGPDYEMLRDQLDPSGTGGVLRFETEAIGEPLFILSEGLRVKRFPNCASAHRAMDGLLELMALHRFGAADVRTVTAHAAVNQMNNLMYTDPVTPLQAKFSMEFGLAVLLADGDCRLSHFTPEGVLRADIRALYPKIRRVPIQSADGKVPSRVDVELNDGRSFSISVPMAVGTLAAPFTLEQFWQKFDACVDGVLPPDQAAKIRDALGRFPTLESVAPLMEPLGFRIRPVSAAREAV